MKQNWKLHKSEILLDRKLFKIRLDHIENLKNQSQLEITVMQATDSVNVVPVLKDGSLLFAKQYRFGIGDITLELPGGIIEIGENPIQAAQRELQEETGYTSDQWFSLGKSASNPVYNDSFIHHVLAIDVEKTNDTNFDDGEWIESKIMDIESVKRALGMGDFVHPHTIAALCRYMYR